MKIFSLLEKAVFCGRTVQSRIPYRTAAQQYRTVPSRPTSFFSSTVPVRYGTVLVPRTAGLCCESRSFETALGKIFDVSVPDP